MFLVFPHQKGDLFPAEAISRKRSLFLWQYRTNELVRWRMHFSPDAIAEIEGSLAVNRGLKAAGLDKVIEEAQRQIDEFFAK